MLYGRGTIHLYAKYRSTEEEKMHKSKQHFYVTRESQRSKAPSSRKESYVGIRDLTDLDKIKETDIISHRGTIRGIKNRVRAGLANFENPAALRNKLQEDGKVVIYTTSFHGVRSTCEECKYVVSVFHNLRVRVEEKDIYVHKFYHNELEERLQKRGVAVPQVFVGGQHIGGAEQLELLNESGELRRLLAEFPRYERVSNCKQCGGYGFIPCIKCGGSKNSVVNEFTIEFRALRCTHCNENGLEPCPKCTLKEEGEEEQEKEEQKEKQRKEKREEIEVEKEQEDKQKQKEEEVTAKWEDSVVVHQIKIDTEEEEMEEEEGEEEREKEEEKREKKEEKREKKEEEQEKKKQKKEEKREEIEVEKEQEDKQKQKEEGVTAKWEDSVVVEQVQQMKIDTEEEEEEEEEEQIGMMDIREEFEEERFEEQWKNEVEDQGKMDREEKDQGKKEQKAVEDT